MKQSRFAKIRRRARQLGQGMTEYIIIVAVIAVGSIAVYSYFGDTLRHQTSAAALSLAGKKGDSESKAAADAAGDAKDNAVKDLTDFAGHGK